YLHFKDTVVGFKVNILSSLENITCCSPDTKVYSDFELPIGYSSIIVVEFENSVYKFYHIEYLSLSALIGYFCAETWILIAFLSITTLLLHYFKTKNASSSFQAVFILNATSDKFKHLIF